MKSLSNIFRPRTFTFVILVLILSAFVYGFAAANTVPESGAGDGSGAVSGYTISNIAWSLLPANPAVVNNVSFNVAPTAGAGPAATVSITVDAGTTWVSCAGPVGTTFTCSFPGGSEPAVSAITALQVVATE